MRYILGLSTVWYRGRSNQVGAGSADECSESYAHPELSRGGKCVRVKNWQKDAEAEEPEAVSGMRDFPGSGQDADVTDVFPPTRAFPVTGETPHAATPFGSPGRAGASAGSAGPDGAGPGWFGAAGDAARRPGAGLGGSAEGAGGPRNTARPAPETAATRPLDPHGNAGATEILGSRTGGDRIGRDRIGRDRTGGDRTGGDPTRAYPNPAGGSPAGWGAAGRSPAADPLNQGRITWGSPTPAPDTTQAAPNQSGVNPAGAHPARTAPLPRPVGVTPAGNRPGGTGVDADVTDILPPAVPGPPAEPTRAFPATAPGPATTVLSDPWQETPDADAVTDPADHTHDPHEVTVQLDAVQLGDGVIRRAESGQHRKNRQESSDGPVFVDASGRRSRLYRRLGIAVGVACAVYAVVIVSTLLSGNSNAPWLPVEGQQEGKPAGQVDTTPLPSQSTLPSGTGSAAPQTSPSAGAGVTTAPGSDTSAPGTSGTARQPGTGTGPGPSETGTGTQPGGGATDPGPSQSTQAPPPVSPDPSVPTGGGDPTGDPTGPTVDPTTGTDPGGGDTTVNGAGDPLSAAGPAAAPVAAAGPAGTDHTPTSSSLSPENTL
ncbi:hypothetical protein SAM40697_2745 [Streptomyces ambofaciens]|uniref:Translation initiation factor IF-2 n=2 Tax=Streptomyces ambofaciens TaxID=1889 RepID=A0ABM6AWK9_STRAM|nr:hypothetical protein SAM40697_2745 [Streptomyces ambofaciens]